MSINTDGGLLGAQRWAQVGGPQPRSASPGGRTASQCMPTSTDTALDARRGARCPGPQGADPRGKRATHTRSHKGTRKVDCGRTRSWQCCCWSENGGARLGLNSQLRRGGLVAGPGRPVPPRGDRGSASSCRSVVGIPSCESLVQLQPRQTYTIYVRALNVGGPSARSEPVTVHTTGKCPGHMLPGT